MALLTPFSLVLDTAEHQASSPIVRAACPFLAHWGKARQTEFRIGGHTSLNVAGLAWAYCAALFSSASWKPYDVAPTAESGYKKLKPGDLKVQASNPSNNWVAVKDGYYSEEPGVRTTYVHTHNMVTYIRVLNGNPGTMLATPCFRTAEICPKRLCSKPKSQLAYNL